MLIITILRLTHNYFDKSIMQEGYLFDAIWLSTAFLMGSAVRKCNLPALIGFLLTGHFLNSFNLVQGNISQFLDTLSSLGVNVKTLQNRYFIGLLRIANSLITKQTRWAV